MIKIIVAVQAKDRGIGYDDKLLFKIGKDIGRFKKLTTARPKMPVIMGRKTWQSIDPKWRPLPDRTNIIVTRDHAFREKENIPDDVVIARSIMDAVEQASKISSEIYIAGGGQIYQQALELGIVDIIELTLVQSDVEANIFFPDYSTFGHITHEEKHFDEKTGLYYSFLTIEKNI